MRVTARRLWTVALGVPLALLVAGQPVRPARAVPPAPPAPPTPPALTVAGENPPGRPDHPGPATRPAEGGQTTLPGDRSRPYWLAEGQRSEPAAQEMPRAVYGADPIRTGAQIAARARLWLTANGGRAVPYNTNGCWPSGRGTPCAVPDYRADCSGYVSMALGLSASLVTGQLATSTVSIPIGKESLQQGDMLINPSVGGAGHTVIFDRWTTGAHTAYWAYEEAGDAGTRYVSVPYPYFGGYQMSPYRYVGLIPAGSLTGDLGAEAVQMQTGGVNTGRFLAFPNLNAMDFWWGSPFVTASGWSDPARVRFADLNGDGRRDLVRIGVDGVLTGFLNVDAATNWWAPGRTIGTGWTEPNRVFFADLNGDGKDDLLSNRSDGSLWAWPNVDGGAFNWGTSRKVGDGWGDPGRLFFADLNGDGRDEIIFAGYDGLLRAYPNVDAINYRWGTLRRVGDGWADPNRIFFADLTGDGRDEVVLNAADGRLWAYLNVDAINFVWGAYRRIGEGFNDPARTFLV